jgi:hypothetical protein
MLRVLRLHNAWNCGMLEAALRREFSHLWDGGQVLIKRDASLALRIAERSCEGARDGA